MMKNIKPLNKNLYVQLIKSENKTSGGIYLPSENKNELETGIVISVSNSSGIVVGDKVIFKKHSVTKADENFLFIKEDDILGIIIS